MSRHHWMYFGCQCSSARCSRLLLERPTLLGIFSAEIIVEPCARTRTPRLEPRRLCPFEIELRPGLRSIGRQRALLPYRVRTLENPVLPRGEPAEDLRFERLGTGEAEV